VYARRLGRGIARSLGGGFALGLGGLGVAERRMRGAKALPPIAGGATEGFGIVGPLGEVRPSWKWLGVAGLVGGAPTFIGAMLSYSVSSEPLELAFYALAGGAILYVMGEIGTDRLDRRLRGWA